MKYTRNTAGIMPSETYATITPDDDNDVAKVGGLFPRGLSLGAAGTLSVLRIDGVQVDYAEGELVAGVLHPIRVARVRASGTGATPIKLYW